MLAKHAAGEVTTVRKSVGADDRQRDVVAHPGGGLCGEDVPR
jgi:hypothetical protein